MLTYFYHPRNVKIISMPLGFLSVIYERSVEFLSCNCLRVLFALQADAAEVDFNTVYISIHRGLQEHEFDVRLTAK
jgi:hypothetical protein